MNISAQQWIHQLALLPHPEGGFYRENHRAACKVQSHHHQGPRSAYTSIYYLLADHQFSAWHRVASDESWFFHCGADLEIFTLSAANDPSSALTVVRIGADTGQFSTTIPAGTWFAARPSIPNAFCLVSCVVAPGFEFTDFELATREQLHTDGYTRDPQWPLIETLLSSTHEPSHPHNP